jgi:hypothetical protein
VQLVDHVDDTGHRTSRTHNVRGGGGTVERSLERDDPVVHRNFDRIALGVEVADQDVADDVLTDLDVVAQEDA